MICIDCNERNATRKGLCPKCYMRKYRDVNGKAIPSNGNGQVQTPELPAPSLPETIPAPACDAADRPVTITDAIPVSDPGSSLVAAIQAISAQSMGISAATETRLSETEGAIRSVQTGLDGIFARMDAVETRPIPNIIIKIADRPDVQIDGARHKVFPEVLTCAANDVPVMLVGPSGSGKTTLARQVAEALGRPFHFTGAILTKFELLGYCDANGIYRPSVFRKSYHGEESGVFLWDEIDSSDAQATKAFNSALENGHADFPDGCIERSPSHWPCAAANTYGRGQDRQYVGSNQLDASTIDRFAVIDMDYDDDLELRIAGNTEWTRKIQTWRKAMMDLKIRHVISPRASIRGNILLQAGMDESKMADMVVWKGLDAAQREKIMGRS